MLIHRSTLALVTGVVVFANLSLFAAPAAAQEDPIAAAVKAGVKDLTKPFTMIVRVQIKPGTAKQFERAFAKAQRGTRKEKGNITYDLNRDTKQPTRYLVYERWRNFNALQAHLQTPHIKTLLSEIQDIVAGPPEVDVLLPVEDQRK